MPPETYANILQIVLGGHLSKSSSSAPPPPQGDYLLERVRVDLDTTYVADSAYPNSTSTSHQHNSLVNVTRVTSYLFYSTHRTEALFRQHRQYLTQYGPLKKSICNSHSYTSRHQSEETSARQESSRTLRRPVRARSLWRLSRPHVRREL